MPLFIVGFLLALGFPTETLSFHGALCLWCESHELGYEMGNLSC